MAKDYKCLRCGGEMVCVGTERIQLGKTSWLLGDLPNLISGAMEVEIWYCKGCGKVEFFAPEGSFEEREFKGSTDLPQKRCNSCGRNYDFDFPKCPYCGHHHY